ncbi:hypothetical protein Dimus_032831 [Dionaea muscipula]
MSLLAATSGYGNRRSHDGVLLLTGSCCPRGVRCSPTVPLLAKGSFQWSLKKVAARDGAAARCQRSTARRSTIRWAHCSHGRAARLPLLLATAPSCYGEVGRRSPKLVSSCSPTPLLATRQAARRRAASLLRCSSGSLILLATRARCSRGTAAGRHLGDSLWARVAGYRSRRCAPTRSSKPHALRGWSCMAMHLWPCAAKHWCSRADSSMGCSRTAGLELPVFDFEAVATATDNFSDKNKLGEGGFGCVYKGLLDDGREVAVKRLSQSSGQGTEQFKNELVLIAKLQHRNLVRLLGCCVHRDEKILIYEFLPNKSLDSFIFSKF